jgi:peptide/nickel transport system permease protein
MAAAAEGFCHIEVVGMLKFFWRYLIPRIIQYFTIIFVGITVTFIIPRLSPTDPVEAQISMMMARGNTLDPQSVEAMRAALTDMGLSGTPLRRSIWGRCSR